MVSTSHKMLIHCNEEKNGFAKEKFGRHHLNNPLVAQTVKHLPTMWETQVQSLGWEDPLEKEMAPLQYSCLENPMDRGAW